MDFSLCCKFKLYCDVTPSVLLIEAYFVIIDYNLLCTIHKSRNLNKIYRHNRIKHEFQIRYQDLNKRPMNHIAHLRNRLFSPLGRGRGPSFQKLKCSFLKDALCHVWLKLAQWFWRRSWECKKFTDRQKNRRQAIGKAIANDILYIFFKNDKTIQLTKYSYNGSRNLKESRLYIPVYIRIILDTSSVIRQSCET